MSARLKQKKQRASAPEGYRYWAFISYSHADEKIVNWLHASLEQYRLPAGLHNQQGGAITGQLYPIFRDRDELPSSADLSQHLHQALTEAKYLIVVCSPRSAQSLWVNEEVKSFKAMGRASRVLCMIVDGEPNASDKPGLEHLECFPAATRFDVDPDRTLLSNRTEVIAADARKGKDGKRLALLKLIAGLAEANFADLVQRQDQRRFRRLMVLASLMSVLALAFGVITWQAVHAKIEVEKLYRTALSRQLAHFADAPTSGEQNVATNILLGALLANLVEPTIESQSSMLRSILHTENMRSVVQLPSAAAGVTLSPDGKLLATANWDGSVSFISPATLRAAHPARVAHKEKVLAVAFSPDGRIAASGGVDQCVQFWDAATGTPSGEKIHAHNGWVSALIFLSGGGRMVTAGWDGQALLWDVHSKRVSAKLLNLTNPITALALSPNGRYLALAAEAEGIFIINLADKSSSSIRKTGGIVQALSFSPDNRHIAAAGLDRTIDIFDLQTGKPSVPSLTGHQDGITSLAFSPDGKYLASSSWDKTIRLWDMFKQAKNVGILRGHGAQVTGLVFASDNHSLYSSALDHNLIIWDLNADSSLIKKHRDSIAEIRRIALSPNGKLLATAGWDGTVLLYGLPDLTLLPLRIWLAGVNLYTAVFSPDGKTLAIAGSDKKIYLWDTDAHHFRQTPLLGHQGAVVSLGFSPDGKQLASGDWNGAILLWDTQRNQQIPLPAMNLNGQVTSIVFSPDGQHFASAGDDEAIAIWTLATAGRTPSIIRHNITGQNAMITSLSYSHDGKFLASAGEDETVAVWDTDTYQQNGNPIKLDAVVSSVAFDRDDRLLATGTVNGDLQLWDVASRRQFGAPIRAQQARISNLSFSPDGKAILSGAFDGTLLSMSLDQRAWKRRLCLVSNRNLSKEEWTVAVGSYLTYQPVCDV
ncbi:TIR domain-containing protein [Duganella qianjiadongensis]|uniref:TIR domain-containing protein n=1 Tax=Duganella qianjiadongensis TaxID=2692176 RepID=A0ABW9VS30_9BURK|nr:TIR domain-containing protein [Duganella qianjiadongensis]MYM42015.1 TIR domain-containing protein [Duganella qianjiadongensis]